MSDSLNHFQFSTLVDLLHERALHQPNKLAFIFLQDGQTESSSLTYQELDRLSRAIAAQLQSLHLVDGERLLLLYPPGLEFIAAFFGCLYAGVVAVPAYPPHFNRPIPRLQAIVADAQATVALTTTQILSNGSRLFTHAPDLQIMQWLATDSLTSGIEDNWRLPTVTKDTLAFLQYTSGSTSTPKGVMVSHGNLLHNEQLIKTGFEHTEQTVVVGWLPLFHDMGLIGNMLQPLYLGIPCILMPPVAFLRNPLCWLQAISRYKATTSGGPNFAYDLCVSKITPQQRATLDLSSWEVAFNGAEPVRAETIERFARTFGDCGFRREAFYPCYGMAETTLIVSGGRKAAPPVFQTVQKAALEQNRVVLATSDDGVAQKLVGCGQPLQDLRVVIAHPETLTHCSVGEVGEIWVSGSSVAQGYWNRNEETQRTFCSYLKDTGEGPFLRTGDLGFLLSGELFIIGRLKDLIIIRGRNHYPQDIELTVENSHPALQPAFSAAFAINVTDAERLVVVAEVKRSYLRNLDIEEVIRAIRQAIAENYELQVYGVLLLKPGSIPKTSSGKIQRYACRASFLNGSLDVVGSSILEGTYTIESEDSLTREVLLAIKPQDQLSVLESYLQKQVARTLLVAPSQLHLQQPLSTLGLDSLNVIELKNSIETNLGVVLPMKNFLQGDSIARLASQVLTQLIADASTPKTTLATTQEASAEHPLSYGQRALWFLHQLASDSSAYNIVSAVRLKAELNVSALQCAFQKLVERHSALRTTFTTLHGEPVQQVHEHINLWFEKKDASTWSESNLNDYLLEEAYRPFNLEQGSLLRLSLFTRSSQEHILLLAVHHIVADLWSLAVLMKELGILYQAEKNGTTVSLPSLALQYTDYSHWHSEMLASPEGKRLWGYWQKQLAGELPVLNLPTDRPRPPIQTNRGASISFHLSADLTHKLKTLSRDYEATLYMTLLAAFQVLLYRYTGQEDILVGSPTAGRSRADLAGLVGYFVNPVVLRADLSGNPTFETFLNQVCSRVLDAFEYQDYPFALLVEQLQPIRESSRSSLFQVMFVLQKAHLLDEEGLTLFALGEGTHMNLNGLEVESLALEKRVAQFDLTLMMAEADGGLVASFEYNTDLFEVATIALMARHLQTLLEGIVTNPKQRLSMLPILTETERQTLLVCNNTKTNYPQEQCIHELFEAQVERTPDAVAVIFEGQQLTYSELNCRANQLAYHLQLLGVGPEVLVGICVERSLEMVIGILGILKANGVYVPLDPMYPKERLDYILKDAQAPVLLTQERLLNGLPENGVRLCLDRDWKVIARNSKANPTSKVTANNLAYTIYTSGSTGQPKGVQIEHRGLLNLVFWHQQTFTVSQVDRATQLAGTAFDASVWELWPYLVAGASIHIPDEETRTSPLRLRDWFVSKAITISFLPTPLAESVLSFDWPENLALRILLTGGDKLYHYPLPSLPFKLVNNYGPTENTVVTTSGFVSPKNWNGIAPPIGNPIANTQVYILDSHLEPLPIGIPGEIYIGGDSLARGYLNQPELTAQRFTPNPFNDEPGTRLYKTGDLARYLPDGTIEFLGRIDYQVKIRGFRIETEEIEAVLRSHPAVQEAVVMVREDVPGDKLLVSYVTHRQSQVLNSSELSSFLKEHLPKYMIPSAFVLMDVLPMTPNGKVDRRSLPRPDQTRSMQKSFVAPRSLIEEALTGIWAEVLGLEQVSIYDDFFELGGHSLLATQVLSRLHDTFQVDLPLHRLFEVTTVAELAQVVIANEKKPGLTEKIAQVLKKIEGMSAKEMRETLQKKKGECITYERQ